MIILLCRFLKVCYKHYNPKQKYNAYYTDSGKHKKLFRQKQDNWIFFVVKYPVIIAKDKFVKGNKYLVKVSVYKQSNCRWKEYGKDSANKPVFIGFIELFVEWYKN